ncbi:MAG: DnaJ domain-containing protein [Rhodospirillales bacterium]
MTYLILGIALLAGVLLAGQWYVNADPKSIMRALKWLLIVLILAVALFFVLSGRLMWALAAIPALLPWFFRARQAARAAKAFHRMGQSARGGPSPGTGQTSDVATRYLAMTLDHVSGEITGRVTEGRFAGRELGDLGPGELRELLADCHDDADSLRLLETYLDRHHPDWRDDAASNGQSSGGGHAGGGGTGGSGGTMDRRQALDILGLDEGASAEDIREAHRRLIANLHPDKGGSSYLAAQINRAKDVLLG